MSHMPGTNGFFSHLSFKTTKQKEREKVSVTPNLIQFALGLISKQGWSANSQL